MELINPHKNKSNSILMEYAVLASLVNERRLKIQANQKLTDQKNSEHQSKCDLDRKMEWQLQ